MFSHPPDPIFFSSMELRIENPRDWGLGGSTDFLQDLVDAGAVLGFSKQQYAESAELQRNVQTYWMIYRRTCQRLSTENTDDSESWRRPSPIPSLASFLANRTALDLDWWPTVQIGEIGLGSLTVFQRIGLSVAIVAGLVTIAANGPAAFSNAQELYVPALKQVTYRVLDGLDTFVRDYTAEFDIVTNLESIPPSKEDRSRQFDMVLAEIRRKTGGPGGLKISE